MLLLAFLGLLSLPSYLTLANDPAPGLITPWTYARQFHCERMALEAVRRSHPGVIAEAHPRGSFIEEAAVVCAEPVVQDSLRGARDAAILMGLTADASGWASRLAALADQMRGRTWLVEVNYPSASVSAKISFAAKSALLGTGISVTDRKAPLAVGDLQVLSDTKPMDAYPLACKRYFSQDRLQKTDAVLSLLILDRRETMLHAGTCIDGEWTWLQ